MGSNPRRGLGPVALLCLALVATGVHGASVDSRPNIIFIMADDQGYNDVGYHNSMFRTPNLDKMAAEGVRLENYYVQPICSPSRSQLMSGRYQIHTGLQNGVIGPYQAYGLPLNSPTLANLLKDAGYSTHMVGKWHLGFFKKEYLPNNRGFDSFYGLLTGSGDFYTHTKADYHDLHDNFVPDFNQTGRYATELFSDKAIEIVRKHASSGSKKPFFLFLSHQAVHSPLQVPARYLKGYNNMGNRDRKVYAGMVTCMDEGIGNLTAVLKETGLMDNTVIAFSTDNGGQDLTSGNNYPLRGRKWSLFEGGIRGLGFVHSPLLKQKGYINRRLIHVSDWFPTLVGLARGSLNSTLPLDGVDQWKTISENAPSARTEVLHNINPLFYRRGRRMYPKTFDNRVQAAIRVGDYKLVTGNPGPDGWAQPPEGTAHHDIFGNKGRVNRKNVNRGNRKNKGNSMNRGNKFNKGNNMNRGNKTNKGNNMNRGNKTNKGNNMNRGNKKTKGNKNRRNLNKGKQKSTERVRKNLWLFNITEDPEERHDLSASMPEKVKELLDRLKYYHSTSVPPIKPKRDPNAAPERTGVWGPWM